MRNLLRLSVLTLAWACSPQPYVQQPPARYQGDGMAIVYFSSNVDAMCREIGATSAENAKIVGCTRGNVIVLPNPFSQQVDPLGYRDIVGHEWGHARGWPATHPAS